MSDRKTINVVNEDTFEAILTRLIDDREFRQAFFEDPETATEKLGIHITPEELATYMDVVQSRIEGGNVSFVEGLVLCSSSGY